MSADQRKTVTAEFHNELAKAWELGILEVRDALNVETERHSGDFANFDALENLTIQGRIANLSLREDRPQSQELLITAFEEQILNGGLF